MWNVYSIHFQPQEKALVGAFYVITNLRMDIFETLVVTCDAAGHTAPSLHRDGGED